ncbi:tetratricopeptide repeat protein [Acrocarpospora sp. B8E8]|uniref:tetratricopeptide repeat protein n=1 Tax=Acrocarpospora sp. B8E8 TaxID=3153572 RepID=UPI00325EB242
MSRDPHSEHVNSLDGTVHGPAVQARNVTGGIHIHQTSIPLPTPRQLPPARLLIDRRETLAFLDRVNTRRSASGSPVVVVVSGPAGVGKSTLSLTWAHRNHDHFPDGQLYADLRGHATDPPVEPAEVLGLFIRAFGIAPDRIPGGLAERAALYQSLVNGRRIVVVLDDAISAAQVRPLLPASGNGMVLVTSRWRLAGLVVGGARGLQVERLGVDAALDLLRHTLGDDRVGDELDAATELVDLCAGVPLAVSVAAARLATRPHWPLTEMVAALAQESRRLSALSVEDDMTIRAALTLSYQNLAPDAARLYRLLGLFPGASFGGAAAAAAAGLPAEESRRLLGVLADANLLDDLPGGEYRFHDLVRLHARETAELEDSATAREESVRRAVGWFLDTARAASDAAAPYRRIPVAAGAMEFADAAGGLDWMDREFRNLRAAAQVAFERGWHETAWQLVDALWPLFLHRGFYAERLEVDRLGLAAARAAGDPIGEAKMLNRTGVSLRALGRWDEAAEDFGRALEIWRGLGNAYRVAGGYRRLGWLELDRDRPEAAIRLFAEALEGYQAAGEVRRVALARCDLGRALVESGRAEEAVPYLAAAYEAAESDRYNRTRALILLGRVQGSEPDINRGLQVMRELGSASGEAFALQTLGELALRHGRPEDARELLNRARQVLNGMGSATTRLDRLLAQLE